MVQIIDFWGGGDRPTGIIKDAALAASDAEGLVGSGDFNSLRLGK